MMSNGRHDVNVVVEIGDIVIKSRSLNAFAFRAFDDAFSGTVFPRQPILKNNRDVQTPSLQKMKFLSQFTS